jgi:predicted secreted Zn-dependent protease
MNEEEVNAIIKKAGTFLKGLRNYSRDQEINKRINTITANMARTVGYRITNDPSFRNLKESPIKQEIKKQLISEMINQRVFEKVKDKKEPSKVAEKLSQAMTNELTSLNWSNEKVKLFMESICMIYETKKGGIKVF